MEEVEATPVVAVVEEDPTPVVEDAVVTVVATSVDETCHSQDDVPQQDATPSLPETKEESTTSEAIEESSALEIIEESPAPETIEESLVPETIEESPAPEIIEESPIPESVEEVIEAAPTEPEEVEPEVSSLSLEGMQAVLLSFPL